MDRDRKVSPLKTIQGLVWERGFGEGELTSEMFPDVPASLEHWHAEGKKPAIYDLSPFVDAYFDAEVGSKRDAASYGEIARGLHQNADRILFLSGSLDELDAASTAMLDTALCVRSGNAAITRVP